MSVPQREIHVETHFSSTTVDACDNPPRSPPAKAAASSQSVKSKGKKFWPLLKETDDFWYPAYASTPPPSFTPGIVSRSIQPAVHSSDCIGLISLIRRGLCKGHDRGNVRRAALCYDQVVHINRETWDACWGCG